MKLFRTSRGSLIEDKAGQFFSLENNSWDELIARDDLYAHIRQSIGDGVPAPQLSEILAPIGNQEVWAAGVTYYRSRDARMQESKDAGGGSFYDRVYAAERPELFFKATPHRVVGSGAKVAIRADAAWSVPEPELALYISPGGKIGGYTIGNDMTSRDIE